MPVGSFKRWKTDKSNDTKKVKHENKDNNITGNVIIINDDYDDDDVVIVQETRNSGGGSFCLPSESQVPRWCPACGTQPPDGYCDTCEQWVLNSRGASISTVTIGILIIIVLILSL